MGAKNGAATVQVSAEEFKAAFRATRPLIEREWPSIDEAALEATGGDLERVTELIAGMTPANVTVRRHLVELHRAANERPASETAKLAARIDAILERLETRTATLTDKVQKDLLPMAETKAKENIWRTILIALGLGVLLGLFLRLRPNRGP